MKKNNKKKNLKDIAIKLKKGNRDILKKQYSLGYFRQLLLQNFSIVFMLFFLVAASFTANIMYDYLYSLDTKNLNDLAINKDNDEEIAIKEKQKFDFEKFKDVIAEIEEREVLFGTDFEDSKDIFK